MEWVKLHAVPAYYLDGALLRAGEQAEVLFCRALAHCGATESAGLIDKTVLTMLVPTKAQQRADALVREGLWLDEGLHYRIRSWERHQDAHDLAAEKRRKDRERQREHRKRVAAERDGTAQSQEQARDSHRDKRDRHDVEGEGEGEGEKTPPSGVVAGRPAPPKRGTRIPDDWPAEQDRDGLWRWAQENAPAVAISIETANWRDWHLAKGDTAKDWNASWRTWMRRAQSDAEKRTGGQLALVRPGNPRVAEQDATLRRWMDEAKGAGA